jgi:hypothetical protein
MTDRFSRRKERLITHEQGLIEQKEQAKRLGQKLPEDSVKIPKIGEWALSPIVAEPLSDQVKPPNTARETKSPRRVASIDPVYHIRPPKQIVEDPTQTAQTARTRYPAGATSTDLNVIMRSRVRSPKSPLPPLRAKSHEILNPFLPLEILTIRHLLSTMSKNY